MIQGFEEVYKNLVELEGVIAKSESENDKNSIKKELSKAIGLLEAYTFIDSEEKMRIISAIGDLIYSLEKITPDKFGEKNVSARFKIIMDMVRKTSPLASQIVGKGGVLVNRTEIISKDGQKYYVLYVGDKLTSKEYKQLLDSIAVHAKIDEVRKMRGKLEDEREIWIFHEFKRLNPGYVEKLIEKNESINEKGEADLARWMFFGDTGYNKFYYATESSAPQASEIKRLSEYINNEYSSHRYAYGLTLEQMGSEAIVGRQGVLYYTLQTPSQKLVPLLYDENMFPPSYVHDFISKKVEKAREERKELAENLKKVGIVSYLIYIEVPKKYAGKGIAEALIDIFNFDSRKHTKVGYVLVNKEYAPSLNPEAMKRILIRSGFKDIGYYYRRDVVAYKIDQCELFLNENMGG